MYEAAVFQLICAGMLAHMDPPVCHALPPDYALQIRY